MPRLITIADYIGQWENSMRMRYLLLHFNQNNSGIPSRITLGLRGTGLHLSISREWGIPKGFPMSHLYLPALFIGIISC